MTDSNYLWDRSDPVDPDVARLEEALGGYRYRKPRRKPWWLLALAAAALLAVVFWPRVGDPAPAARWEVAWETGTGAESLAVGEWLETGAGRRARLFVPKIGNVEVAPDSRLRIARSDENQHRLQLERGQISAVVTAPPRLFIVDTPAAAAVDLGCAYTLEVDAHGNGELAVTLGEVQLEKNGIVAYVPRGATCSMRRGAGPGVPYYRDAPASLRDVAAADEAAVRRAMAAARPRDMLTLWNLVPRVSGALREAVVDRIAGVAPLPSGVARDRILALDRGALETWRDELP